MKNKVKVMKGKRLSRKLKFQAQQPPSLLTGWQEKRQSDMVLKWPDDNFTLKHHEKKKTSSILILIKERSGQMQ
jgi:hypothetical protein